MLRDICRHTPCCTQQLKESFIIIILLKLPVFLYHRNWTANIGSILVILPVLGSRERTACLENIVRNHAHGRYISYPIRRNGLNCDFMNLQAEWHGMESRWNIGPLPFSLGEADLPPKGGLEHKIAALLVANLRRPGNMEEIFSQPPTENSIWWKMLISCI